MGHLQISSIISNGLEQVQALLFNVKLSLQVAHTLAYEHDVQYVKLQVMQVELLNYNFPAGQTHKPFADVIYVLSGHVHAFLLVEST